MRAVSACCFVLLSGCTLFQRAPESVEGNESCSIAIVVLGNATLDLTEDPARQRWWGWEDHHVYQPAKEDARFGYEFTDSFELVGDVTAPGSDLDSASVLHLGLALPRLFL